MVLDENRHLFTQQESKLILQAQGFKEAFFQLVIPRLVRV